MKIIESIGGKRAPLGAVHDHDRCDDLGMPFKSTCMLAVETIKKIQSH